MRLVLLLLAGALLGPALAAPPSSAACDPRIGEPPAYVCVTRSWQPLPGDLGYYRQACAEVVTEPLILQPVCVLP